MSEEPIIQPSNDIKGTPDLSNTDETKKTENKPKQIITENLNVKSKPVIIKRVARLQDQSSEPKIIKHDISQILQNRQVTASLSLNSLMSVANAPKNPQENQNVKITVINNQISQNQMNQNIQNTSVTSLLQNADIPKKPTIIKRAEIIKHKPSEARLLIPPDAPKQIFDILVQPTHQVPQNLSEMQSRILRNQPHARIATIIPQMPQQQPQLQLQQPQIVCRTITQTQIIHQEPKQAAPNPLLPSATEIKDLIKQLDDEIAALQRKCEDLNIEKEFLAITVPDVQKAPVSSQVLDFHGTIFSKGCYSDIYQQNKQLIAKSHNKVKMPPLPIKQRYKHIAQLPYYNDQISTDDTMEFILGTINNSFKQKDLYEKQLTAEYFMRREIWFESNFLLNEYHADAGLAVNKWPPEFEKSIIKPNDKSLISYCANDLPMYLSQTEKETMLYYDENMLVEDPVAEHEAFKRRLTWTEEEKQIFYEKYAQHPKEFKKIAAALPLKSTKDVIEYYSINRKKLNLHEVDIASRKRGKRRMTEGGYK